ncbi:MAG TPA: hypothetical protein VHT97_10060 [Acidimicrobiales bacterium]|jgi:hypothetical protein|nr:hypothetical protein [Acidimicrobiales bacterium]
MSDEVSVPRSELIAVSRLLWDVGSQQTTSHHHKVDCFHWGAVLDHHAGLPPWPNPGPATEQVIEFYERVERHVRSVIESLVASGQPPPENGGTGVDVG